MSFGSCPCPRPRPCPRPTVSAFSTCPKRAVQFTKKLYLPLFLSETADKFARDYAIKKSFRHTLHLVTAYLHRQNQVARALRSRDFWLASLSIHFPTCISQYISHARRAHEYPVRMLCSQRNGAEASSPTSMDGLQRLGSSSDK